MAEKLYVLGHPVGHSKSPAMHNAAYEALGLHWQYGLKDCPTEIEAQVFLNARNWRACNVTMPWKQLAFRSADKRTAEAGIVQGANTLVHWGGRVYADNTDGRGCVHYLKRCGTRFKDALVVVCGTGPTSLAIAHACVRSGASKVVLAGRDLNRASLVVQDCLERLGALGQSANIVASAYGSGCEDAVSEAQVIIDATPLGMHPGDPSPFDTSALRSGQIVMDVVYGHGETSLLAAAQAAGCEVHDGRGMLVAQAVESIRFIERTTGVFSVPAHLDLFAIMARAAEFEF